MVDVTRYTLSKFIKAEEFRNGKVIVDQINAVTEDPNTDAFSSSSRMAASSASTRRMSES